MESRERYFIGNPQLDFILSQIGNRLDTLEGLRPDLAEGFYKLSSGKSVVTSLIGSLTFDNTGLHIEDTDASDTLTLKPGSNLTADRILTITTGDASRTVTISGDVTIPEIPAHVAAADPHPQYQKEAEKDSANGYAGLNAVSRTVKGVDTTDDLIVDLATKGLVLKDTAGTPHYWRVSVSVLGVLTTADLGTVKP